MKLYTTMLCLITGCLLSVSIGQAEEIQEIRWATPEWQNITNKDGTGLYNEILDRIFEPHQITLIREYVPWKRALIMVAKGHADMTGGEDPDDQHLQATHPIVEVSQSVLFKRSVIPQWKGLESLKGRRGVWVHGYRSSAPAAITSVLLGREVKSRVQAVLIVANDRGAEYYYDNSYQMMQAIQQAGIPIDLETTYQMEEVHIANLYWRFHDSDRGRQIRDLFDQGIERLYCSGELELIYGKWQSLFPTIYQIKCP